eukprot:gene13529-18149_t
MQGFSFGVGNSNNNNNNSTNFQFGQTNPQSSTSNGTFAPQINFSLPQLSTTGGINSNTTSTLNNPLVQQQQQNQQNYMMQSLGGLDAQAIEKIQKSYAPHRDHTGKAIATLDGRINEECEFKTIMYNPRYGNMQYQDPMLTGSLLEQAEHNNLDPENFMPVREVGIISLKNRFDKQNLEVAKLQEHIKKMTTLLQTTETANNHISIKFDSLKAKQIQLYQSLLSIMRKVEVLRCHGVPLRQNESRYRERLNQILGAMKDPHNELQQLSTTLVQLEHLDDTYRQFDNEEDLENIFMALQKQREGLEYITDIL